MRAGGLLALMALAACATIPEHREPYKLTVEAVGPAESASCRYFINGEHVPEILLQDVADRLPNKNRQVVVETLNTAVPWRCVGGVIYLLQTHGFKNVGFISTPPDLSAMPMIMVSGKSSDQCVFAISGQEPTSDQAKFRDMLSKLNTDYEYAFQPEPTAPYECVGTALDIIKELGFPNIGFVGNYTTIEPDSQK